MAVTSPPVNRRAVLAGVTAAFGGFSGCANMLGRGESQSEPVLMLAAGSLNNALENGLRPRSTTTLRIEARGSTEVARLIAAGQKDPDIVSVADTTLFDSLLDPDWFAEFATNAIVIAYNPETEGGRRVATANTDEWYRPLLNGEVSLGRTDPDLDPLGYRTLFMLELATDYYPIDTELRNAIPKQEQLYPETQLVSQFEIGAIDTAITYRNMAVERGYEYVDLPVEIDLSDPEHSDRYSTTTYELADGTVVSGGPISYGSTIRHQSSAVTDVFEMHTAGQHLNEFGFDIPDDYPRYTGDAPDEITD